MLRCGKTIIKADRSCWDSQGNFSAALMRKLLQDSLLKSTAIPKRSSSINNPKRVTEVWADWFLGEEIKPFWVEKSAEGCQRGCVPFSEVPGGVLTPMLTCFEKLGPKISWGLSSDLDYPHGLFAISFGWIFFFFKFKINCNIRASLICGMGRLHWMCGGKSVWQMWKKRAKRFTGMWT